MGRLAEVSDRVDLGEQRRRGQETWVFDDVELRLGEFDTCRGVTNPSSWWGWSTAWASGRRERGWSRTAVATTAGCGAAAGGQHVRVVERGHGGVLKSEPRTGVHGHTPWRRIRHVGAHHLIVGRGHGRRGRHGGHRRTWQLRWRRWRTYHWSITLHFDRFPCACPCWGHRYRCSGRWCRHLSNVPYTNESFTPPEFKRQ